MKSGKKFNVKLLPALLCLVAMLVAACGNNNSVTQTQKAPNAQQHMHIAFEGGNGGGDMTTFDPALASDTQSGQAISMVFTGMVQLNNDLKIQPQLASSWDTSPNGLKWTFHLKHNLKFSDGNTLDASDVAYSINRALSQSINNLSGGLAATYLGQIKDSAAFTASGAGAPTTLIGDSIKVVDENTLELDLSQNAALDAAAQVKTQNALAAADVMPNGDARYSAYNAPEQQLVNDVAWLPLFQYQGEEAIKPYITGYPDNAQQIVAPDDWSKIFVTVH
ncbi:MAG: ABC transporter substrate-binding protein [Ktedonobacteraceae bacterium]